MANNEYHAETPEETSYRINYLQKKLLRDKGYYTYAAVLDDFIVNFVNIPGITAAIDTNNYVVLLDQSTAYDSPQLISALIRHELLHKLLRHLDREIIHLANVKGLDYAALTKVQFDEIQAVMNRPDFTMRQFNSQSLGNKGADLDLSRYYLDADKEALKVLGGLFLDDHPEWQHLTFEEILHECYLENLALRKRVMRKVVGTFSDVNGKRIFTKSKEIPSDFSGFEIHPQDIIKISLPTIDEGQEIVDNINESYFWLLEDNPQESDTHAVQRSYGVTFEDVEEPHYVLPVLIIKNADLYKNIFKKDSFIGCKVNNTDWFSIPNTNRIVLAQPLCSMPFNDVGKGNELKGSLVEKKLNEFFSTIF